MGIASLGRRSALIPPAEMHHAGPTISSTLLLGTRQDISRLVGTVAARRAYDAANIPSSARFLHQTIWLINDACTDFAASPRRCSPCRELLNRWVKSYPDGCQGLALSVHGARDVRNCRHHCRKNYLPSYPCLNAAPTLGRRLTD